MLRSAVTTAFCLMGGATLLVSGCQVRDADIPASARDSASPPRVEWAGCRAERIGTCYAFRDRPIVVWVDTTTHDSVSFEIDGRAVATSSSVQVQGGWRFHVPSQSGGLVVRVDGTGAFRLDLRSLEHEPRFEKVEALRAEGRSAEALTLLRSLGSELSTDERAVARNLEARISTATVSIEQKRDLFLAAAETAHDAGLSSTECASYSALVYHLLVAHRLDEALAILARSERCTASSPATRVQQGYLQAMVLLEGSVVGRALELLKRSHRGAQRIGMAFMVDSTRLAASQATAELGRFQEAADDLLEQARTKTGCDRIAYMTNYLHVVSLGLEADDDGPMAGRARELLSDSESALGERQRTTPDCPYGLLTETFALNRASLSLRLGQEVDLTTLDEAMGRSRRESFLYLEYMAVRALNAYVGGRFEMARKEFRKLELEARRVGRTPWVRVALIGQARVAREEGRPDDAISGFRRAFEAASEEVAQLAAPDSEQSLAGRFYFSVELIELLLSEDRPREAMEIARKELRRGLLRTAVRDRIQNLQADEASEWLAAVGRYRRALQQLEVEAAERWQRPVAELPRLDARRTALEAELDKVTRTLIPGASRSTTSASRGLGANEARVVIVPLRRGHWHVFGESRATFISQGVASLESPAEGATLLAAVRPVIDTAERVLLVIPSSLSTFAFHAIPFQDSVFGAQRQVVYSLDIDGRTPGAAPRFERVVLAAATEGLPWAAKEVRRLQADLADAGLAEVRRVSTIRELVDQRLHGPTTHLHFSGHGVRRDGQEGLKFASGQVLTARDALILGLGPGTAVLSACDTIDVSTGGLYRGLDLPQALIVNGSSGVIAAPVAVGDQDASAFVRSVYRNLFEDPSRSIAEAYRRAVGERSRLGAPIPFRLVTP